MRFLPRADAVIFVTGFDSRLTRAEAGFLAAAARYAGKLFLVVNKRDLAGDRDAAEALEFLTGRLRTGLGLGRPRLFAVSALEALEAVVQSGGDRLGRSGLPPLRAARAQRAGHRGGIAGPPLTRSALLAGLSALTQP